MTIVSLVETWENFICNKEQDMLQQYGGVVDESGKTAIHYKQLNLKILQGPCPTTCLAS